MKSQIQPWEGGLTPSTNGRRDGGGAEGRWEAGVLLHCLLAASSCWAAAERRSVPDGAGSETPALTEGRDGAGQDWT